MELNEGKFENPIYFKLQGISKMRSRLALASSGLCLCSFLYGKGNNEARGKNEQVWAEMS